jgi:hypothetical protein
MEQDKVFNRKLFKRKNAARDKLRSMGGIMASSEPLIQEAMRTVADAPQPQIDLQGIMAAQKRRGPMPAQPLPQMMPGQAPGMPAMAQAPQPQMQQPAPQQQPQPGMNPMQAQQGQPMRMFTGGRPMDRMMGGVPESYMGAAMGNIPQVDVRQRAGSVVSRPQTQTVNMEDITPDQAIQLTSAAMSGKFPVNLSPFTSENAGSQEAANLLNSRVQSIGATMQDPGKTSEEKSREIIAALGGNADTDNIKDELNKVTKQTYGKELGSEAKIDAMNRAITGFAIAAGTSPRATKNIANGMLAGLQAMKSTEEGRVSQDRALQLAAAKAASKSGGSSTYDKLYKTAVEKIMTRPDEFGIFVDEDDPAALDSASNQITTLADRIARAQMGGGGQGPSTSQPMTDIVTVTTQEDYDALEPGTPYIDSETGARSVKRG